MAKQEPAAEDLDKLIANSQTDLDQLIKELPDIDALLKASPPDLDAILKESAVDFDSLLKSCQGSDDAMRALMESAPSFDELFQGEPDEAVTEQHPPPDPNLTSQDAARWMATEVEGGHLHHGRVVRHLRWHYGERFTRMNGRRNRVIALEVLDAFLALTCATVVWVKKGQYWRLRRSDDPEERQVV